MKWHCVCKSGLDIYVAKMRGTKKELSKLTHVAEIFKDKRDALQCAADWLNRKRRFYLERNWDNLKRVKKELRSL